jgi:hypothetical protein
MLPLILENGSEAQLHSEGRRTVCLMKVYLLKAMFQGWPRAEEFVKGWNSSKENTARRRCDDDSLLTMLGAVKFVISITFRSWFPGSNDSLQYSRGVR